VLAEPALHAQPPAASGTGAGTAASAAAVPAHPVLQAQPSYSQSPSASVGGVAAMAAVDGSLAADDDDRQSPAAQPPAQLRPRMTADELQRRLHLVLQIFQARFTSAGCAPSLQRWLLDLQLHCCNRWPRCTSKCVH
jgi:hypothetical protein